MSTRSTFIALSILVGAVFLVSFGASKKIQAKRDASLNSEVVNVVPSKGSATSTEASMSLTVNKEKRPTLTLNGYNTVIISGPIGAEAIAIAQRINALSKNNEPIYLLINSPGGSVMDGAQIITAMQASSAPVYTVCLAFCASQAAIIHEYGTKRFMQDRAILMFHEAAGGFEGSFNQIYSRFAVFNKYVNKMDAFVANRVGLSLEAFKSQLGGEVWLDSEDATAKNFNDKIVNVSLDSEGKSQQGPQDLSNLSPSTYMDEVQVRLNNVSNH